MAAMNDDGMFSEEDVILNRLHIATQAARTGGPGGLVFNGRGCWEPPFLNSRTAITPLPYPAAFQPVWYTTKVSVVEAERCGATSEYMAPSGHALAGRTQAQTGVKNGLDNVN